jgi:hypothetical protein
MDRSKVMAVGLLAAVFAAGLIVGGVGSGAIEEREQTDERPERKPYIETLTERLDLSPEQREQIDSVLHEFSSSWRALSRELQEEERSRIQEIRVDARSRIIAALDGSQADIYRAMIARDDSVRAARADRRRR